MGRHGRPPGQRVPERHHDVRDVVGQRGRDDVLRDGERHVPPGVDDPDIGASGRDQVHGVPRLALGQRKDQVGVRGLQVPDRGGDEAPRGGGEGRQAQPSDHGAGLMVQPGLDPFQVGEQPCALLHQVPARPRQQDAAAHSLQQDHTGLPLEPLDLLGHRAGRVPQGRRSGDDRPTAVDGPQRHQGGQIDHARTLPGRP